MEPLPLGAPLEDATVGTPAAVARGGGDGLTPVGAGELVPSIGGSAPGVLFVGASDAFGRVTGLVDALVAELSDLSLAGAERDVLRSLVAALGRVRAGADAAEARAVTALESLADGGVDAVEVLRRNAGSSQREAQRRKRRAEALAAMPNVADALAAGDISAEHAEALARAAAVTSAGAVDGDAELLAQVSGVPADRAGRQIQAWTQRNQDPDDLHEQHLRQRRRRRLQFGDGDDGMLMAHAAFDRVLGTQFRSLINGIADRIWRAEGGRDNPNSRSPEQRRLDALAIAVGLEPGPPAAGAETAGAGHPTAEAADAGHPAAGARARDAGHPTAEAAGAGRPTAGVPRSTDSGQAGRAGGTSGDDCGPGTVGDAAVSGRNGGRGGLPVSPRHQVVIVASADVVSGADPQGRCEIPGVGPIPQSELERLACDAELFGLLFSGDGEPLWHGRGKRTATDAQWQALLARDGVCVLCADEPARCEAHHIVAWAKPGEGPTDIDNLALLCGTCHRRLHDNKLILTRDPDGTWGTAPDPRHTGRPQASRRTRSANRRTRSANRSANNGDGSAGQNRTSACRTATLEMTARVGDRFVPLDGRPLSARPLDDRPPDGRPLDDRLLAIPRVDSRPLHGGPPDGGPLDDRPLATPPIDRRPLDGGPPDGGPLAIPSVDSRPLDGGPPDGGPLQGGLARHPTR